MSCGVVGARATVRLAKPAEAFKAVTVATLEGLKSFDGAPVTPWTLTFTFGN